MGSFCLSVIIITIYVLNIIIERNRQKKNPRIFEKYYYPDGDCPTCGREYSPSNRVQFDPISGAQMCDICYNDLMNRRIMFEILF